jgi:uncharacterized protein (TIGR02569 family)
MTARGSDSATPVPATVLDAFGLTGPAQQLTGGEGRSVRVGAAVLKPTDDGPEARWTADLLTRVEANGFRLARPLRALDGRWVVDGWSASSFVDGESGPARRWEELLAAGRAFHAALSSAHEPTFLASRTHRWAVADRVAWGEASVPALPGVAQLLSRLESWRLPVAADCQLVHGDLSGNVLFADGQPPAIIDFSPYWRPAAYADAIIAVDGLLWFDAGPDLLRLASDSAPDFPQLLVRALIFRLVAMIEQARDTAADAREELAAFDAAASEVEALLR